MITLAKAGKRVVRLKGGDPMIFGRAGEEIAACRAAGIEVEVVPGITAAQGVASRIAVSLTQRRVARRVQYVTGHAEDGKLPNDIDWGMVADPTATTVVYMPRKTIGEMAAQVIANGLDAATPAVAVINGTRPDETIVIATLAEIGDRLDQLPAEGPAVVVIGLVLQELYLQAQADDQSTSLLGAATVPPRRRGI
jgi:uroporphyrin-III C-methyltransferase/precorrin-2 dehydrogenase/sirohydrochlorin ferrochelatase